MRERKPAALAAADERGQQELSDQILRISFWCLYDTLWTPEELFYVLPSLR